ncbi:MAG: hypothetical protein ACKO9I_08625, partial [Sphaerospermopsis kisseleviana]
MVIGKIKLITQSPVPSPQSPVPSPQSPVPSPQSPVPSPQSPVPSPQSHLIIFLPLSEISYRFHN